MRVTCKHCGGAHPAYECRKKSTAPSESGTSRSRSANESLPVDTNSKKGRVFAAPLGLASPALLQDADAANNKDAPIPKRRRGRPKTITDMASYKAMKQREYRARKK